MKPIDIVIILLIADILLNINNHFKLKTMAERTEQAIAELQAINTRLQKIGNETAATLLKVKELEEAAANNDTPQEVLDKIAEVKAQAQIVDELTPDAEPPVEG